MIMKKLMVLLYGITNYNLGSASLVCLIAFLFNFIPENPYLNSIDYGNPGNTATTIIVNLLLITLFGLQHSIMARPNFKKKLIKFIPEPAERSTFMLVTAIAVFILCIFWQPMTGIVWQVQNANLYNAILITGLLGWGMVFYATFIINHFDLFGLRQVWLYFKGQEYTHLPFTQSSLYKYIRHPIMSGVFIGIWLTPTMTTGHLLFALGMSVYIVIGVYHEEKDLVKIIGNRYLRYIDSTGKFFPKMNTDKKDLTYKQEL
ncbi:MAG: hypothetical protein DIZ80_08340 [endosymbiont of Galathealinum brachiosum]|uniref:NnrU domain-containing protein n=1 Tax=endosymbiont of Galathealinum brachiosum TaxID=2200906 RepID=A0A370DBL8_9GAMM|nr:MAG: hypothetical protein DIZ80_08340 [endosymbiont of Galathealinum brachiosum]